MKKAMIITVGTGNGVDSGIAFAIKQQNPDYLCFIVSDDSRKTFDAVLSKIGKMEQDVKVFPSNEVNDVEFLYRRYSAYFGEIIQSGYAPHEIVADYTSGTKSMSAALVSAAIAQEIGILSYVYGDRDTQGRVISNSERLSPLSPTAIFTEQKIKTFKTLFNQLQFESALVIFQGDKLHHAYKTQITFLQQLAHGYAEWDKFNFEGASEKLNQIDANEIPDKALKKLLLSHRQWLHKIKINPELTTEKAIDLFCNAQRRFQESRYDDSVARLYRVIEMIGQIEFMHVFSCTTDKVPLDIIPQTLRTEFESKADNKQMLKIGLFDVFQILKETNNEKSNIFEANIKNIKKILSIRNESILAHGVTAVKKSSFETFSELVNLFLPNIAPIEFPKL